MRQASLKELSDLDNLEKRCFEPYQQDSRESIRRSLLSQCQELWVTERDGLVVGALTIRINKKSLRITSVSVSPEFRSCGLGSDLMDWAFRRASDLRKDKLILEVNSTANHLIEWYRKLGFKKTSVQKDFYMPGKHAIKMQVRVQDCHPSSKPSSQAGICQQSIFL